MKDMQSHLTEDQMNTLILSYLGETPVKFQYYVYDLEDGNMYTIEGVVTEINLPEGRFTVGKTAIRVSDYNHIYNLRAA
jgi:hypothetical protein